MGHWDVRNRVVLAALFVASNHHSSAAARDLADEVAARNRTAVESIQTLSCRYSKARYRGDGKLFDQLPEIQYWRSGWAFRSRWKRGEKWRDTIVVGLQQQTTSNELRTTAVSGSVASFHGFPLPEGDPWLDTLVMFLGDLKKNPSPLVFADLLKFPGLKASAKNANDQGKEYAVVELVSPNGTSRADTWFNPRANYMACRRILKITEKGKQSVETTEVERFTEAAPGIYFPEKVTKTYKTDGQVTIREVSMVKEARVNHDLPADTFKLGFKPGTMVQDLIQGKRYTLGSDGRTEVGVDKLAISNPPVGIEQLTETKAEPRSLSFWLLPLSLLLLATSGVLWLARRRRARQA